jgi:hypothetical protein
VVAVRMDNEFYKDLDNLYRSHYDIDWKKVSTIEDIKAILKKFNIKVNAAAVDGIEHLLKED